MWKTGNIKKLRNEDLYSAAVNIACELRYNVWCSELDAHLSALENVAAQLNEANTRIRKNDLTLTLNAAERSTCLAYRQLYIHLMAMTADEQTECAHAARLLLRLTKQSAYAFNRLPQSEKLNTLSRLFTYLDNDKARSYLAASQSEILSERLQTAFRTFQTLYSTRNHNNKPGVKPKCASDLRPLVVESICKIYLFIYSSPDEENKATRLAQLAKMETIVRNTPKHKYVRKATKSTE